MTTNNEIMPGASMDASAKSTQSNSQNFFTSDAIEHLLDLMTYAISSPMFQELDASEKNEHSIFNYRLQTYFLSLGEKEVGNA